MFDVQKFMNRMGWNQKDLAERLDCSQSRVAMWNTGRAFPRYSELEKLINLGMNADELLGEDLSKKLASNGSPAKSAEQYNSPEFQNGVKEAILAAFGGK